MLEGNHDHYGGVTISSTELSQEHKDNFTNELSESLEAWKALGKRGIWFKVDIKDSFMVPLLTEQQFVFHHAQTMFVMMNRWLPDTPSTLPKYAHTNIGAGGVVVDGQGRFLMMREKKGHYLGWKFPGGLSEPNEDIFGTAEREVLEETGIRAVAESILLFRQVGISQFEGIGDIYFVCAMKLANEEDNEITPCPHETADARWFTRQEINEMNLHSILTRTVKRYDEWKQSGRKGIHRHKTSVASIFPVD